MESAAGSRLPQIAARLATHTPTFESDQSRIWAAVAVILVPDPDAFLLIRRAERAGDPWSGHMALPGGRQAATDATLLDTAIRESAEEVGIELLRDQCIGILDDVAPRTPVLPPIAVRPYVFALPSRPIPVLNWEVASTHWIPIDELLLPDSYRKASVDIRGLLARVDAYHVAGAIVWGMTERILAALRPHL